MLGAWSSHLSAGTDSLFSMKSNRGALTAPTGTRAVIALVAAIVLFSTFGSALAGLGAGDLRPGFEEIRGTGPSSAESVSPSSYPPQAWGANMVYDSEDGYFLMFGGSAEHAGTWRLSNGTWSELHPTIAPHERNFACMAYDTIAGEVVLFGGGTDGIGFARTTLNDTWTFAGGNWRNVTASAGSPPAVKYPACAYDPALDGGAVVLFGGAVSTYSVTYDGGLVWLMHDINQTWAFAKNSSTGTYGWVELHPGVSPSARFGAAMAYNSTGGPLILYGGAENGTSTANDSCPASLCPHLHDTWVFSGTLSSSRWTRVSDNALKAPPGSVLSEMVGLSQSAGPGLIDFGGQANGYKALNATPNATWEFSGSSWVNITPSAGSPPTRFGGAIAYDAASQDAVMFSGLGGTLAASPVRDDAWAFSGGVWHPLTYPVTFHETGGASGASWKVVLSNESKSSNTTLVEQDRPNGTWAFSVDPPIGYVAVSNSTGIITVSGGPATVNVTFGYGYPVRLKEKGLPTGTNWTVTIGISTRSSLTNSIAFSEANGTYGYTANVSGNGTATGRFTVDGVGVSVLITFYRVTFSESGLPPGTNWKVSINELNHSSSTNRILWYLANGTYSYVVGNIAGYKTPGSGSFAVTGKAVVVRVKFTKV